MAHTPYDVGKCEANSKVKKRRRSKHVNIDEIRFEVKIYFAVY